MDKQQKSEAYAKKVVRSRWSLALRRYVMDGIANENYAPYFGLDASTFRKWLEIQFVDDLSWDNYGKKWQFDHIVPVVYFDFDKEEDLKLCWNFINIRVEPIDLNRNRGNRVDVLAVKAYFLQLFDKTGFSVCQYMIEKIEKIEVSNIISNGVIEGFIIKNKKRLESIASLNKYEFNRFNAGADLNDILFERDLLKKFGS